jgi:hypothetical protein
MAKLDIFDTSSPDMFSPKTRVVFAEHISGFLWFKKRILVWVLQLKCSDFMHIGPEIDVYYFWKNVAWSETKEDILQLETELLETYK